MEVFKSEIPEAVENSITKAKGIKKRLFDFLFFLTFLKSLGELGDGREITETETVTMDFVKVE